MAGDTLEANKCFFQKPMCVFTAQFMCFFFSQLLSIPAFFLLPYCTNFFGASAADPVVSSHAAVCDCGSIGPRKTSRQVSIQAGGQATLFHS